jgi:phosphoribosyl 1,2-cyclic phosphodiesterase
MDHIQGLGFFGPLYRPGLEVHIWGPPSEKMDLRSRLTKYLSPPLFPVPFRDLPCNLSVHDVPLGEEFSINGLNVVAQFVIHPGPTLGYRIAENGTALAYLPDHEPALGVREFPEGPTWTSGFDIARGVDLLIHDAQYSDAEYPDHLGWGHSTVSQALAFAAAVGAKRLVLFHHDPGHSDTVVDRIIAEAIACCPEPFEIVRGTEGLTLKLLG